MSRTPADDARDLPARIRERRELEDELIAVNRALGTNATPSLEQLRVATPCPASWDEMRGSESVRFCEGCEKNVYNLSAMTSDEARALLATSGETPCVRFYRRADGTVITNDCPVGVKKRRVRLAVLSSIGGVAAAVVAAMANADAEDHTADCQPRLMNGATEVGKNETSTRRYSETSPHDEELVMGKLAVRPGPAGYKQGR